MEDLFALILAGGRGARFWPVSRRARPKQCVSLDGGPSLIRKTVDRVALLVPKNRILVATGPDMLDAVRAELPDLDLANFLVEPSPRNTAPCIGWGAVEVLSRAGRSAVLAVIPSDHHVGDPAAMAQLLRASAQAARATNALVTLGVRPTRPETGFGYLEVGPPMGRWGQVDFNLVERFTEKPKIELAQEWLVGGKHLWNAGMFVFCVETLLDAFREHLPASSVILGELQRHPERLSELWESLEPTSIDYGIMEKSRHILCAACSVAWSDVGSWTAAEEVLPETPGGHGEADRIISIDSMGNVVKAPNKTVALLGVNDLVIVDTPDALLVMHKARAQDLRDVLTVLEQQGVLGLT